MYCTIQLPHFYLEPRYFFSGQEKSLHNHEHFTINLNQTFALCCHSNQCASPKRLHDTAVTVIEGTLSSRAILDIVAWANGVDDVSEAAKTRGKRCQLVVRNSPTNSSNSWPCGEGIGSGELSVSCSTCCAIQGVERERERRWRREGSNKQIHIHKDAKEEEGEEEREEGKAKSSRKPGESNIHSHPTCVFRSSLSSVPATSRILRLIGFLSVRLSLVGLTMASRESLVISPTLYSSH